MRTSKLLLILLMLPVFVYAQTGKPQPVSDKDCAAVFSRCEAGKYTRTLEGAVYCEAWNLGIAPGDESLLGYVLRKPLPLAGADAYLLVGVERDGTISKVSARNAEQLHEEFLAQFEGKSLSDSWEIARTPEDLLHVPAMLKAVRGRAELSAAVVNEVKTVLEMASLQLLKLSHNTELETTE